MLCSRKFTRPGPFPGYLSRQTANQSYLRCKLTTVNLAAKPVFLFLIY